MALMILKSTDAGAPTLNGVNGSLCNVLNWALVQNGWAVEYTATNARVYRPGSGNRRRLHVRHDSAISGAANKATVRGCENATSATALTDPFPTTAQVVNANSVWMTSNTADSTARAWEIYLDTTFFYLCIDMTSGAGRLIYFFGDVPPAEASDVWNTMVWQDADPSIEMSYGPLWQSTQNTIVNNPPSRYYWCRNIDGTVKSIPANLITNSASGYISNVSGCPIARQGHNSKIYHEKVAMCCPGAQATVNTAKSILRRGWMPHLWAALHSEKGLTVVDRDTFTNTAYNASAIFRVLELYNSYSGGYPWIIFEETNTWSNPG